ncbi:MAG: hypothetical protein GF344_16420 [Chitinivibrionales bacterium]|nr:hypothetical protein [Chitinivibrionales bacterium]MBD3358281.1 hypothetical protein [Chitinivibrionales bacterium]
MTHQRLYVVHGRGNDEVGLMGGIAGPISKVGGNIVDLRQDVLHGLFTVLAVVDLSDTDVRIEQFTTIVERIAEDTGLQLSVDKYNPIPRDPEKRNMLMILVGNDRSGIITSVAETLGKYRINIESAQSIGRQDVFLTELLTDISHSTLPLENIKSTLRKKMAELNIHTLFQTEDVFNKEKRMIVFDIGASFIEPPMRAEILEQTGLTEANISEVYSINHIAESLKSAAALLEGFPTEVLHKIIDRVQPTSGTLELLQTLRVMGYRIALVTTGFAVFGEAVRAKLGIDHVFGYPLLIDDDTRAIVGDTPAGGYVERDLHELIAEVTAAEEIRADNVSVITDEGCNCPPGIRLEFDLERILEYYNKKIVSRDALLGILGCFGIPRA